MLADNLGDGRTRDQVVDDRGTGILRELANGDQRGEGGWVDDPASLVHDEAPIRVTVESQADVGTLVEHRALEVTKVLRLDGIGLMVREGAVELKEEWGHTQRKTDQDRGNRVPTHPVARVDHDVEVTAARERDQRVEERRVLGEDIALGNRADGQVTGRDTRDRPLTDQRLDLAESGVLPDG